MKNFTIGFLVVTLFASFAQATLRMLPKDSDGLNLTRLLLLPDTQKCLHQVGFKEFSEANSITDLSEATIHEEGPSTTYVITINQYKILPTDGIELDTQKKLSITATKVRSRAGTRLKVTCSFGLSS